MTCVDCKSWSLRGSSLAKHGFGNCGHRPAHEYRSASAPDCEKFRLTDAESAADRQAWLDARQSQLRASIRAIQPINEDR